MPEAQGELATTKPGEPRLTPSKKEKGSFKKAIGKLALSASLIASTQGNIHLSPDYSLTQLKSPGLTQSLSLADLEQRVEMQYQVDLVTAADLPQDSAILRNDEGVQVTDWDKKEIIILTNVLDRLPLHFYSPRPATFELAGKFRSDSAWGIKIPDYDTFMSDIKKFTGEDFYISQEEFHKVVEKGYLEIPGKTSKVHFFMVNEFHPKEVIGKCYCNMRGYNDTSEVGLSSEVYHRSPWGTWGTFSIITHELTHRVSNKEDYEFVRDLLGMHKNLNFDMLYGRVSHTDENSVKFANALKGTIVDNDVSYAHEKFKYGLTNPNEFVSVASEFYLLGKDRFIKAYGVYIEEEKSTKLYDYMRNNIFKGQEYQDGKKLVQPSQSIPSLSDGSLNYGNGIIGPSSEDIKKANSGK